MVRQTLGERVFMTHANKAIYKILLSNVVKIRIDLVEDILYDEHHWVSCY